MIPDQTIHASGRNTPAPFVTNAALDEVKDSIQELRSILLRGRGGPYQEPYYGVEMDNCSRSRQSGGFGPPFEPDNGPIVIPASPDHPPPGVITIPWQPNGNPGGLGQRPRQFVRLQSPSRSPIIIQPARSRSSSRDRYNNVDTGFSRHRRSDATGRELESVISDFSSIVIIVGAFFSKKLLILISRYCLQGHLPRLCIHRDARTRAQCIRQPRDAEIERQQSFLHHPPSFRLPFVILQPISCHRGRRGCFLAVIAPTSWAGRVRFQSFPIPGHEVAALLHDAILWPLVSDRCHCVHLCPPA